MKKLLAISFTLLVSSQLLLAQLSGTRNVPSDNYPNFQAIVDSLNLMEINTGGIVFNISGDQVFNHSPLIINGSGSLGNPIIIQWDQTGEKPIVNITGTPANDEAGITLSGTDYFTIDGISINAENQLLEYGIFLSNAAINNACQHNVFKNLDISLDKTNPNQTIGINVLTEDEPTFSTGIHADNKFFNNRVQNCIMGYNFDSGTGDVNFMGFDNEVGSINDGLSLITDISLCGVYLKGQNGAKVHHTQITDLERIGSGSTAPAAIATTSSLPNDFLSEPFEIHDNIIDNHHSGSTSIFGFYLNARKSNHLIYNNIINNLSATGGGNNAATGIMLFGTDISATIYNNMISDIAAPASSVSGSPATKGIELRSFSEAYIFYNSVQLSYTATNSGNSSAALYVNNDDDPVTLKNNIFINIAALAFPSTGIATAFYKSTTTLTNINNATSNNLYFSGDPSDSHPIFYAHNSSSPVIAETLEDYQALVNFDQTAFTGQVDFINNAYLYVNSSDPLVRENAIPIDNPISILEDIDGELRSLIDPDLGADELPELFPTVAVNPSPEDLSTEIPVSLTTISWDYFDIELFAIPVGFKVYLSDSDDFSGLSYTWIAYEEDQTNYSINIADILELEHSTSYFWKVVPTAQSETGAENPDAVVWQFTIEPSTSIELINNTKALIYPNPVSDFISIHIREECDLSIYSISGGKVFSNTNQKSSVLIPVRHLESGIYLLMLQTDNEILTERFIVK